MTSVYNYWNGKNNFAHISVIVLCLNYDFRNVKSVMLMNCFAFIAHWQIIWPFSFQSFSNSTLTGKHSGLTSNSWPMNIIKWKWKHLQYFYMCSELKRADSFTCRANVNVCYIDVRRPSHLSVCYNACSTSSFYRHIEIGFMFSR